MVILMKRKIRPFDDRNTFNTVKNVFNFIIFAFCPKLLKMAELVIYETDTLIILLIYPSS